MASEDIVLRYDGVSKEFDGNYVLKNVSFSLEKGIILGLVGENGAGKSTMMNILFGMNVIKETGGYEGKIIFEGKEVNFSSPMDALDAGIGMVHQEFSLIPNFTATENIMLNTEITKPSIISRVFGRKLGTLDRKRMRTKAEKALGILDVDISPDMLVAEMPIGHKQFLEIAREIDRSQVKLLVFDEPTAVLTETEADILIKAMKKLAAKGIAIIFISHRLHEVLEVCDQIIVLRDGEVIKDTPAKEVSVKQIAECMVGRQVSADRKRETRADSNGRDIIMKVENLWVDMPGEKVRDVSFEVRRGEIFGIGGLAGQGKLGIPNGIMGIFPAGGRVSFHGKVLPLNSPGHVLQCGLAFVSEDRRGIGLLLDEPIYWNVAFSAMQVKGKYIKKLFGGYILWRDEKGMKESANRYIKELDIKCISEKQKVRELSGGNQQKVCLAKAFDLEPEILFVSEPTRGIDVGAKALVLRSLMKYNRERNTTIVIVSSELEELRALCDRIAIISEGKIAGILDASAASVDFGILMSGISNDGKKVSVSG